MFNNYAKPTLKSFLQVWCEVLQLKTFVSIGWNVHEKCLLFILISLLTACHFFGYLALSTLLLNVWYFCSRAGSL